MNEEHHENGPDNDVSAEGTQKRARPVMKFNGSGGLNLAIWKAKSKEGYEYFNVTMDRTYRNDEGKFVTTESLRDSDLLRAQQLLGQADAWIEQEKAKTRRSQGGQSR